MSEPLLPNPYYSIALPEDLAADMPEGDEPACGVEVAAGFCKDSDAHLVAYAHTLDECVYYAPPSQALKFAAALVLAANAAIEKDNS